MSQRDIVVGALLMNRALGVSNHDLIYQMGITRAAAIIHELREEGFDIETIEGKAVGDGRVALCTYVIRSEPAPKASPGSPVPPKTRLVPVEHMPPLRALPEPLRMPCGCVRSADGRQWLERCQKHVA